MSRQHSDPLTFFATQSAITDPRDQSDFFDNLPRDIRKLCEIVRGIFLHIELAYDRNVAITAENSGTYTRFVDLMLKQIRSMSSEPIKQVRTPDKRLIGNCRDDSVLLCSLLRHLNIPSRVRYGFSKYFAGIDPRFSANHVICEFWNESQKQWILVDSGQDEYLSQKNRLIFDPHDVPRDQFITAAQAWISCRSEQANAEDFGFGPIEPTLKGQWYIQTELMHEFASFNRMELLLRDRWGLADCWHQEQISEADLKTLDHIADLIFQTECKPKSPDALSKLGECFHREDLKIPNVITCHRYDGTVEKFDLRNRKSKTKNKG